MRKALIVCAALVLAYLLWGPISVRESGTLGKSGTTETWWGVLGWAVVHTELSWYGVGNVPVSREVNWSPWCLAGTVGVSGIGGFVLVRLWSRRRA